MLTIIFALAALFTFPTSAMAAFNGVPAIVSFEDPSATKNLMPTRGRRVFKSIRRASTRKKSERQKCLDMMLPQDGADCMKKLKAKEKKK